MVKEIVIIVIAILLALIFSKIVSDRQYLKGYSTGCLVTLWWVQNNTSCKDAVDIYMMIQSQHPEDSIFVWKKTKGGKAKQSPRNKRVRLGKM